MTKHPRDFPPHNTVFYYFNKRKLEGVLENLWIFST